MRMRRGRVLVAALGSLLWLSGCETTTKLGDAFQSGSNKLSDFFQSKSSDDPQATASVPPTSPDPLTTGSANARLPDGPPPGTPPGVFGSDGYDDLNMGKKFYRTGNFGMAERSFRRAVETHPKDAEAWLGLAASYDELKRFDLADRAYEQTIAIVGTRPEVLNNRGYSYMLRGDFGRARTILLQAQSMDPSNPYIRNNLVLLGKSVRRGKMVEQPNTP
jgi:tetratricopeptide (TPR) repeat protein